MRNEPMDRPTATFVDGMGAAAATSGVLTQLQGRIFALLYLQPEPLALEQIAADLEQSKSHVSVSIRGLVEWHLVRRIHVGGSRKDHYEAATDFWRVMQEIMERRYRWNVRQVLVAVSETKRAVQGSGRGARATFVGTRLDGLGTFFTALDAAIGAITQGQALVPETVRNLLVAVPPRPRERSS